MRATLFFLVAAARACASSWSPVGPPFARAQVVASDLDFLSAAQAAPALPLGAPVLALGHASAGGTATEFFGWTGAAWVTAAPAHTPGMAQRCETLQQPLI